MAAEGAKGSLEIHTPRLILRAARLSDIETYHAQRSAAENHPFGGVEGDGSLVKTRTTVERLIKKTALGETAFMIWTPRETGEAIGYGGYNYFKNVNAAEFLGRDETGPIEKRMTEPGLTIDHRYWRKGFGLEIVCGMVEYAFSGLGCELILFETDLVNEPFRELMRTAGMAELEKKTVDEDGEEIWSWRFDGAGWAAAKEEMKSRNKWPL